MLALLAVRESQVLTAFASFGFAVICSPWAHVMYFASLNVI